MAYTDSLLILPDNPLFEITLANAVPPDSLEKSESIGNQCNYVADAETGLLRPATPDELFEYIYGGEYDERLENMDEIEIEIVI